MANHAILNVVEHKSLRVNTGYGVELGDAVMGTLAIPSEFHSLQADYPIVLQRDSRSGKFLPMVMFGFEQGENLYLDGDQWQASYVPLMIRRGPFLIGFQSGKPGMGDKSGAAMVISIDMDSPRLGAEGEPLFQLSGLNSDYTDRIADILQQIDSGQAAIEELCAALAGQNLIEPFSLEVRLDSGRKHELKGFYTINEEKLALLEAPLLADFSQRGILFGAYMLVASMANIPRLIALKNRRDTA